MSNFRLQWKISFHRDDRPASLTATVSKSGFPGLVDTWTATILLDDEWRGAVYIDLPHGGAIWRKQGKATWWGPIADAKRWARKKLKELTK